MQELTKVSEIQPPCVACCLTDAHRGVYGASQGACSGSRESVVAVCVTVLIADWFCLGSPCVCPDLARLCGDAGGRRQRRVWWWQQRKRRRQPGSTRPSRRTWRGPRPWLRRPSEPRRRTGKLRKALTSYSHSFSDPVTVLYRALPWYSRNLLTATGLLYQRHGCTWGV